MNDSIYLLSIEEYEQYKENIPYINCWWWLRSPGDYSNYAVFVYYGGSVLKRGSIVSFGNYAVRPAISLDTTDLTVGQRVVQYDFPWIVVGDGVAIAEVPIKFWRFDVYSNDYEKSEIRSFLLKWRKARE